MFRRKVDKSGSAGVPLNDKVLQWRFLDRMSFLKDYIVNRKLVNHLQSEQSEQIYYCMYIVSLNLTLNIFLQYNIKLSCSCYSS